MFPGKKVILRVKEIYLKRSFSAPLPAEDLCLEYVKNSKYLIQNKNNKWTDKYSDTCQKKYQ